MVFRIDQIIEFFEFIQFFQQKGLGGSVGKNLRGRLYKNRLNNLNKN